MFEPHATRSGSLLALLLLLSGPVSAQIAPSGPPPDGPAGTSELRSGANSFTEGQVRDRLDRLGYSNIGSLSKDEHGIWRGQAVYGAQSVTVGVDYRGAILRTPSP